MYYIARQQVTATRQIARSAQQLIKDQTGINVRLLACRTESMINSPEQMLNIVAMSLSLDPSCFRMKTRAREISELRFIGALFLRQNFPAMTLQQIAALFGGQDHSSIINGVTRAQELIYARDERFLKKYNTVLKSVNKWLRPEA